MSKEYFVYILASKRNGMLYVGVTNDLMVRVGEHKADRGEAFTKNYNVKMLVYAESYPTPEEAIHREKCLKKWNCAWKIELIEAGNPLWTDTSSV